MARDHEDIRTRIWCGPNDPPRGEKSQFSLFLNSIPPSHNVFLKASNISTRLAQELTDIALDLLEIAAYVYCADQSRPRGGNTFPMDGLNWYRQFELSIPVRRPGIWGDGKISYKMAELLRFMANDDYQFTFRKLEADFPRETYFEFDDGAPWFKPDSILLFSGGLDSLTGAVEELQGPNRKVLLVSHRPVGKIDKPQRDLVADLKSRFGADDRIFHIPVWINKESGLTKDANQRSRSFLYASIAAAIASMVGSKEIKFYENGIVSSNLPISDQVIEARASRSTHPKTLRLMSELFSTIFGSDFKVTNPFFHKTKSDVLQSLKEYNCQEIIKNSRSCTRTISSTRLHTHCGACSQCIERRLAVLYNGLEDSDPEEMYQTRLFLDIPKSDEDKTMIVDYIGHSRILEQLDIDSFYEKFPDAIILAPEIGLQINQAGQLVYDIHHRHGKQIADVINKQIKAHADEIRTGEVSPNALLGMIIGKSGIKKTDKRPAKFFPTPEDTAWEDIQIELVSNDSIRVKVGNITMRYSGFEIGFTDNRKRDLLDRQWEILRLFAEKNGELSKRTFEFLPKMQKSIQSLNSKLRSFFGLNSNPINRYNKETGWTAKFKISDKTSGKS